MTVVAIRKKLVSYLQEAEEQKVKAIYALVKDDIEQVGRIDIKQYNKELEEAEAEYKKGDYISNAALKKMVKKW
ncbi:MAG TPA: hypothetical protein PKC39_13245 [Ferruginibacter sp.]|nr:hypothetical protein [Ferruginibacter sp.]HMP21919.1 hypothetical protein [Ferruginibacter sp.]